MTHKGRFTTPDGAQLPYLITGSGPRPMVYIPGAGDGLASADQLGSRMKWWLAGRLDYFRVLYVGRRAGLRPPLQDTPAHSERMVCWPGIATHINSLPLK